MHCIECIHNGLEYIVNEFCIGNESHYYIEYIVNELEYFVNEICIGNELSPHTNCVFCIT